MNQQGQGIATGICAQFAGQIATVKPPSLEQRLDYLQRGTERLYSIRLRLEGIVDRVSMTPDNYGESANAPPPADLCGKFGETISSLHDIEERIERLLTRLEGALFEPQTPQCDVRRA